MVSWMHIPSNGKVHVVKDTEDDYERKKGVVIANVTKLIDKKILLTTPK